MEPIKFEENKRKGQYIKAICEECQIETRHLVVTSYDCSEYDYLEDYDCSLEFLASFQIIQCQGCMNVSFRKTEWSSEFPSHDDDEREHLYPERTHRTHFMKSFHNFPDKLNDIYEQTIACYNHFHFTLAAIGLRALLEGICAECKIEEGPVTDSNGNTKNKKNLEGKINGLHEKGLITKGNAEILHEHRFLGNEAAHQLKPPSRDELVLAIEIIENLVETVFEIPHKGSKLKQKRVETK